MRNRIFGSSLMVYSIFFLLFNSCAKKELPAPYDDKTSTESIPPVTLVAPCASSLVDDKITSSTIFEGYSTFYVDVNPNYGFDYTDITCSHYSSSNKVYFKLLNKSGFVGKIKYSIANVSSPYGTVAKMFHTVGSFGSFYYYGTTGDLYAEYTSTKIILTFCDVKMEYSPSSYHTISGKVIVPL